MAGPILGPPIGATPLPVQPIVPQTHLTLSPTRIVAPLESQVVLIAGVCGPNGRYLAGETVEWFLAKDSAGHFLELEGERLSGVARVLHPLPRKLSSDYAVGKTSLHGGRILDCGNRNDEKLWLREGQTWITLTSATEGVSHVTAFSPDGESSPARQETAEVYWVDVQTAFPAPAVVRAGNQALLSITVTRASNGQPLPGWIVRYEIAGGSPASIGPQGAQAAEVVTDQNGVATVNVLPQAAAAGATEVRMTVMRPATDPSQTDRLPIRTESTTITWSAPGLAVQTFGPAAAQVRTPAIYHVQVSNPGDLPAAGVVAGLVVPPGMQFISANPQPRIVGDRLQWELGQLPPQTVNTVEIQLRCDEPGEYSVCSSAQSAGGALSAQHCAATTVYRPAVRVNMTGPETAEVGQTIAFHIEVVNEGPLPLRNVVLIDRFSPGLQSSISASPLENALGDMAAGETRRIRATFLVVAPGQQRNEVEVTTAGGHTASVGSGVNAVAPQTPAAPGGDAGPTPPPAAGGQGRFNLTITGPGDRREREIAEYVVTAANASNVTLNEVQIVCEYSATLVPRFADPGYDLEKESRQISWTVPQLPPGQSVTRRFQCECLREDPQGGVGALAVAQNAPVERREVLTRIHPAPAQPQPAPPGPQGQAPPPQGAENAEGSLKLTIRSTQDPVDRGGRTTFLIVIHNDRNVPDRNVGLTIQLPEGMNYKRLTGPPTGSIRSDGRTVEVPPFAVLRAGERLDPFRLEVELTRPGRQTLTAQLRSQRSPEGVNASSEITVLDR